MKYKLIKEYPGNHIGDIIYIDNLDIHLKHEKCTEELFFEFWKKIEELCVPIGTKFYDIIKPDFIYEIKEIENDKVKIYWPDAFIYYTIKEVNKLFKEKLFVEYVEKDYEILEWRTVSISGSKFSDPKIHSVKRKIDGVVFTIGDKVSTVSVLWSDNCFISGFVIKKNSIEINVKQDDFSSLYPLDSLRHYPKIKLFTTEDNIDIYDSDQQIYFVMQDMLNIYIKKAVNAKNKLDNGCKHKYFSTKKAAENYIKMHKKTLSLSDVLNTYDSLTKQLLILNRNEFKSTLTLKVKENL